jgi:hypothetical protein
VHKHIKQLGVSKALCLGTYNHMSVSSAAHGAGVVQNSSLIDALLKVSPYALFKSQDIQKALVLASNQYDNLVPDAYKFNINGWAALKSERIMVLMNHIRRLKNSDVRLRQACSRLNDNGKKELQELILRAQEYSECSTKPSLSEAPSLDDDALDAEVLACKPMPPSKKEVPKQLDVAPIAPEAPAATAAAKDIKYTITLAKQQSYIQYRVASEKRKLLISVTAKMSVKHQSVVKVMFDHINKNPTLDVSVLKSLRAALLG